MNLERIEYSAATDVGARWSNQDNFMVDQEPAYDGTQAALALSGTLDASRTRLLCVCDGVGGAYMGDVAARLTIEAVAEAAQLPENRTLPLPQLLEAAAEAAQQRVTAFYDAEGLPGGCTLALLGLQGDAWAFLNIGDSPAFLLRETEGLRELSTRHNLAWEKLRRGELPGRNDSCRLLHYMGKPFFRAREMAAVTQGTLRDGDCFLLCSDGITNSIGPEELCRELQRGTDAAELVRRAARAPGADNCTAICLTVRTGT